MDYGYCRISTKKQHIERQIRNILEYSPKAVIIQEVFTGTKFQERKELNRLLRLVVKNDRIIFDSVSRMARNADEGCQLYEHLYNTGIELVFLKEPHINTEVYKRALENMVPLTGTNIDYIIKGINSYLMELAKEQIHIAFEQAEKEVLDLRNRTSEGIEMARRNGKQIGGKRGAKYVVKKASRAKYIILTHNKTFGGTLTDEETKTLAEISRNSLYTYKKQLKKELSLKGKAELLELYRK